MMDAQIERLRGFVAEADHILLTGPIGPDGDSIGACLALARCCRALGARVDVAGSPGQRYAWMDGADAMIPDERIGLDGAVYDLVIVLDGDRHRLASPVERAFSAAARRGIIDHHGTTTADGYDVALIDRDSSSTCEMVLRIMDSWGQALDRTQAGLLYVGVLFDTGGFRHSNTTVDTLRASARLLEQGIQHSRITTRVLLERRPNAMRLHGRVLEEASFHGDGAVVQGVLSQELYRALELAPGDLEGIVDSMIYVRGVEVAVLLVERAGGAVKLSLRSRGQVDVAEVARALHPSGGGHAKAAGVVLDEPLARARERVPRLLVDAVGRSCAA